MNHGVFNALTRRASLMALGTAGLAAIAHTVTTDAKQKRKKNRNKRDADKLCKKQIGQCLDFFLPLCEDDLVCQAQIEICCPELGMCDVNGFFICIDDPGSSAALVGPQFTP